MLIDNNSIRPVAVVALAVILIIMVSVILEVIAQ